MLQGGCATPQNINFSLRSTIEFERLEAREPAREKSGIKIVRVFLDRWGDVHPPLPLSDDCFAAQMTQSDDLPEKCAADGDIPACESARSGGSTRFAFLAGLDERHVRSRPDSSKELIATCPARETIAEVYKRVTDKKLQRGLNGALDWSTLQNSLHETIGQRFKNASEIVAFVHGFRTSPEEAESQYRLAASHWLKIGRNPGTQFLFVFWDGMLGDKTSGTWSRAQFHAPMVGLGLRRVFAAIGNAAQSQTNPPRLRVVSHSLGALVVASSLWNSTGSSQVEGVDVQRWFDARAFQGTLEGYQFPGQLDIRVGMLAPATPSATFKEFSACANNCPHRVIVGFNPQDYAVSKMGFFPCGSWLGSTCLGANESDLDQAAKYVTQTSKGQANSVSRVFATCDFGATGDGPLWAESHAFEAYIGHKAFPAFIAALTQPEAANKAGLILEGVNHCAIRNPGNSP